MKILPTIFFAAMLPHVATAEPIERNQIEVSDGDTVRIGGKLVRLKGFDAPETTFGIYRCDVELEWGQPITRNCLRLSGAVVAGVRRCFPSVPNRHRKTRPPTEAASLVTSDYQPIMGRRNSS
jgi:hypothetical protein